MSKKEFKTTNHEKKSHAEAKSSRNDDNTHSTNRSGSSFNEFKALNFFGAGRISDDFDY